MSERKTSREYLMTLVVGDILRVGNQIRVLRSVQWKQYNEHYPPTGIFGFSILRCSWTRKPYTFYHSHDLMRKGVEKIGHMNVHTGIHHLLDEDINRRGKDGHTILKCCDVIGLIV